MKNIIKFGVLFAFIWMFVSCDNDLDNYEAPSGGIYGTIYDKVTNEPIPLPVEGGSGVLMSLFEMNETSTASIDFRAKQDGTYENSKVFDHDYRVVADGPFVGVVDGYVSVKGQTKLDLYAIPLSRIKINATASNDNKVSINYQVEAADETFVVTNVLVMWGYSKGLDINSSNHSNIFSLGTQKSGSYVINLLNEKSFVDNYYKIKDNGKKIYVRVCAKVQTLKVNDVVNYSEVFEVTLN